MVQNGSVKIIKTYQKKYYIYTIKVEKSLQTSFKIVIIIILVHWYGWYSNMELSIGKL